MQKKIIKTILVYNDNHLENAYAKVIDGHGNTGTKKVCEYTTQGLTQKAIEIIDKSINSIPCTEEQKLLTNLYEILPPQKSKYYCSICGNNLTSAEIGYCWKHKIKPLKCRTCQHKKF